MRLGPCLVEDLEQRRQIGAVLVDAENRLSAIAVQRLDYDSAVPGLKFADLVERTRDQRRRHEARIVKHEHLFGRVDHLARVVDHQRLAAQPVEDEGGADIAQIEGRILPHQHHIDIARQIDPAAFPNGEVMALDPLGRHRRAMRGDPPARAAVAFPSERIDIVMHQAVPARLRRFHQREGGIAGDLDRFHRVHLDGDA